jgi:hypothetical protein
VLAVAQGASESEAKHREQGAQDAAAVAKYDSDAELCHSQAKVSESVGLGFPGAHDVA